MSVFSRAMPPAEAAGPAGSDPASPAIGAASPGPQANELHLAAALARAERELVSSEARLETAVWGAGTGLWELDLRTQTAHWYSDWCERLDLDSCEGKDHIARWQANIHPDDVEEVAR